MPDYLSNQDTIYVTKDRIRVSRRDAATLGIERLEDMFPGRDVEIYGFVSGNLIIPRELTYTTETGDELEREMKRALSLPSDEEQDK